MDHTNHQIDIMTRLTIDIEPGHRRQTHRGKGIGMMLMIGEAGTKVISMGQMAIIMIN